MGSSERLTFRGKDEPGQAVEGLNASRVQDWFARKVEGGDQPLHFSLIGGGRSNLTYRVWSGDRSWVLRRPPLGHVLPTAHDMAREFRILAALAGTPVPVPRVHAFCDDITVIGCPFYVMDYCDGIIHAGGTSDGSLAKSEDRHRLSIAFIDALVALHAVNYEAVGLSDFGRPEGYLERQVRRWAEQWERSKTSELPVVDELVRRLRKALPTSGRPAIVHGDYRLGNMIIDRKDPERVVAILDWEMATIGDPLADLGYTLVYWGEPEDVDSPGSLAVRRSAVTARPGFLSRQELMSEYARRARISVDNIEFYEILALYKLAIITEGIYARYLKGLTLGEGFEGMQRGSVALFEFALITAERSGNPALRGEL